MGLTLLVAYSDKIHPTPAQLFFLMEHLFHSKLLCAQFEKYFPILPSLWVGHDSF